MSACPAPEKLARYARDRAGPEAGLEEHIQSCASCRHQIDELTREWDGPWTAAPDESTTFVDGGGENPPQAGPLRPGERLGEYELIEMVGRGGQGEVWKARHPLNDHLVALKVLLPPDEQDLGSDLRLIQEARAIAGMKHPNVVRIHFTGQARGRWYFSMEFVEGGTVEDRLAVYRDDPALAARVVEKVARAVHYAHAPRVQGSGLLHLDIKPRNVLIEADGEPKVSDFGLSVRLESLPRPADAGAETAADDDAACDGASVAIARAGAVGTAPYMSPEMARGAWSEVSTASDIYGLGALLYTMLTGAPPFRGRTLQETLHAVVSRAPTPPRQLNPRVDRILSAVCLKCLSKDPQRRYGSADALANDLARWARSVPPVGVRAGAADRFVLMMRRHPLSFAAAAFAAAALWVASVVGSEYEHRATRIEEAERLARSVEIQLDMAKRAVLIMAREPGLHARLRAGGADRRELSRSLVEVLRGSMRDFNKWFDVGGGGAPLVNLFVLDTGGTLIADSFSGSRSLGMNFRSRDYFTGLLNPESDAPREHVHVSEVFRSYQDFMYKYAVTTEVRDGGERLALLAATIPVGRRLMALDMLDEPPGASVVRRVDPTYPEPRRARRLPRVRIHQGTRPRIRRTPAGPCGPTPGSTPALRHGGGRLRPGRPRGRGPVRLLPRRGRHRVRRGPGAPIPLVAPRADELADLDQRAWPSPPSSPPPASPPPSRSRRQAALPREGPDYPPNVSQARWVRSARRALGSFGASGVGFVRRVGR
ncbi:MAG: protein kinase [Isosphaeraceae bacterium]